MDASEHFAQSYREARQLFIAAADAADLDVHSHAHPMLGQDHEALAMDVVRDGPRDAKALLMISSACHGVEGFCGSGVQVALLRDEPWRAAAKQAGVAVLYVHALNPYGFSWWRRTTHENVDLNRNFHDFAQPLPVNTAYDEIAALLLPHDWPPSATVEAALARFGAERGPKALQAAVSGGQYAHPEGLFFGGHNPTWSNVTFRHVLQEHGGRCEKLGWIDLHTGLGPAGVGERIFACRDDARALARAKRWWGEGITSIYDGSSTSALLSGLMWLAACEECPQAEYTGIALEYGTVPIMESIQVMRADQWYEVHPQADPAARAAVRRQMRDCFYLDNDAWKQQVLEQAFEAGHQALRGLSAA